MGRVRFPARFPFVAGSQRHVKRALQHCIRGGLDYAPFAVVANAHRDLACRPVWLNPCDVPLAVPRDARHTLPKKFVMRGSWETSFQEWLDDRDLHPTVHEIWVEGKHYTKTTQYAVMIEAVEAFQQGRCTHPERLGAYWCKTAEDVDRYFGTLINAFESIRAGGYRLQADLRATRRRSGGHVQRKLHDEIGIVVASDGRLATTPFAGNHRFSMLRLLEIKRAPALLLGVSEQWYTGLPLTRGHGATSLARAIAEHTHGLSPYAPPT